MSFQLLNPESNILDYKEKKWVLFVRNVNANISINCEVKAEAK